jgi:hypothetical protein
MVGDGLKVGDILPKILAFHMYTRFDDGGG